MFRCCLLKFSQPKKKNMMTCIFLIRNPLPHKTEVVMKGEKKRRSGKSLGIAPIPSRIKRLYHGTHFSKSFCTIIYLPKPTRNHCKNFPKQIIFIVHVRLCFFLFFPLFSSLLFFFFIQVWKHFSGRDFHGDVTF